MASLSLLIKSAGVNSTNYNTAGEAQRSLHNAVNLLEGLAVGAFTGTVDVSTASADPVAASGTITLASAADTQTVTVGGVTFTAASSPAGEADFEIDGDDTADAAALVVAINAHSTLSAIVSATSLLGVVTVVCKVKGVIGNFLALTKSGAGITLSGAALAGGTGGPGGTITSYTR